MKLNDTSMQKLFDLMVMGIKYQVQLSVQPEEIFHLTMKHLQTLKELVEGTNATENILDTESRFVEMCKKMNAYDWQVVR
eukprot:CAMPEP_0185595894 /NCGR_PEP_ID=MMETSP0434-20130131/79885_1 /TAXON_ID=626734 ORGANISM="Favella taraikaensis, Strain Fe Narragansett Bay" /NCGR_SAMPLE_ID=MMETSP0434 /ASSEMBLY_ACC=CAM_ASM_000379 /LENGTH=79 /DNA_ID=CAMNT_0028224197 /DNA_START=1 /DNA_END=240 /DNA_ORIENTATION=+